MKYLMVYLLPIACGTVFKVVNTLEVNEFYFHGVKRLSNTTLYEPVRAILHDLYIPGYYLLAAGSTLYTADRSFRYHLISGRNQPMESKQTTPLMLEKGNPAGNILDICQPLMSMTYFIERSCLKRVDRATNYTDVVVGDCQGVLNNRTSGNDNVTNYRALSSCYVVNGTHLVLTSNGDHGSAYLVDLSNSTTSPISSLLYEYKSFVKLSENMFYGLTNNGIEVGVLLCANRKLLTANDCTSERLPLYFTKSKLYGEDLVGLSSSMILVRSTDDVIIVDLVGPSINKLHNQEGLVRGDTLGGDILRGDTLRGDILMVYPDTDRELILISSEDGLYGLDTSVDFTPCEVNHECSSQCSDKIAASLCSFLSQRTCEPHLHHCVISCTDDVDCFGSYLSCHETPGGERACLHICQSDDDCLFDQICLGSFCSAAMTIQVCLRTTGCLYVPSIDKVNQTTANSLCSWYSSTHTKPSNSKTEDILSAVSLFAEHFTLIWITTAADVTFYYDMTTESLVENLGVEEKATPICWRGYVAAHSGNTSNYDDFIEMAGQTSCRLDETETLSVDLDNVEMTPDNNEKVLIKCLPNYTQKGLEMTNASCTGMTLRVEDCYPDPNLTCGSSSSLPTYATILEDSRRNKSDTFHYGDFLLLSCQASLVGRESHVLICGESGWISNHSLPESCLLPANIPTSWLYSNVSGLCYGTVAMGLLHSEAKHICNSLAGQLALVDTVELKEHLTEILSYSGLEDRSRVWIEKHDNNGGQMAPCLKSAVDSLDIEYCNSTLERAIPFCQSSSYDTTYSGWGQWSSWSACSTSLKRERNRRCNPLPNICAVCTGSSKEYQQCCPEPAYGMNTNRTIEGLWVGAYVLHECKYGYKSESGSSRKSYCMPDQMWFPEALRCTAVTCPVENLENMSTNDSHVVQIESNLSYFIGSCVYRVCNVIGYVFSDAGIHRLPVHCQEDATWSNVMTQCVPLACGKVPEAQNTEYVNVVPKTKFKERLNGTLYYGDVAEFTCHSDYHYKGFHRFTISCEHDGLFSDSDPGCLSRVCDSPPRLGKYMSIPSGIPAKRGTTLNITCAEGYAVDGKVGNVVQNATCVDGPMWEFTDQPCLALQCSEPGEEINARISRAENPQPGDTVDYLCPPGTWDNVTHTQVKVITCLSDLSWDGIPAVCIGIRCEEPRMGRNSERQIFGIGLNDRVEYRCKPGYVRRGFPGETLVSITCTAGGTWNGPPLDCVNSEVPYHGLRVEGHVENMVTMSFIQTSDFNKVDVTYTFTFHGNNTYGETDTINKTVTGFYSRRIVEAFTLNYGYRYKDIIVEVRAALELGTRKYLFRESSVLDIEIETRQVSLISGASLQDTRPYIAMREKKYVKKSVDVIMAFPFTANRGVIRNFTLIVCEMIPYLPPATYNGRFKRHIPTYQQVQRKDPRRVWDCYKPLESCNWTDPEICGLVPEYAGFIGQERVYRYRYRLGNSSCEDVPPELHCNGYLKDLAYFCVKLRAFTADEYFDSPCSVTFQTVQTWDRSLYLPTVLSILPGVVIMVFGLTMKYTCDRKVDDALESKTFRNMNSALVSTFITDGVIELQSSTHIDDNYSLASSVFGYNHSVAAYSLISGSQMDISRFETDAKTHLEEPDHDIVVPYLPEEPEQPDSLSKITEALPEVIEPSKVPSVITVLKSHCTQSKTLIEDHEVEVEDQYTQISPGVVRENVNKVVKINKTIDKMKKSKAAKRESKSRVGSLSYGQKARDSEGSNRTQRLSLSDGQKRKPPASMKVNANKIKTISKLKGTLRNKTRVLE